jgi:hypothetical protein
MNEHCKTAASLHTMAITENLRILKRNLKKKYHGAEGGLADHATFAQIMKSSRTLQDNFGAFSMTR